MRRITFAILTAGLLSAGPASAAMDIFLCSPQIQGETQDSGFPGCSDVLQVSNAGFVEGTAAEPRDLRFIHYVESTSLVFHRVLVTRNRFDEATFWFRNSNVAPGGSSVAHMSIKLLDFTVSSMASSVNGGDDRATEVTSLRPASIEYMYRKDRTAAPAYTCWDIQAGKAFAGQC